MAEAKAQELIAKADKKLTSMFASLFGNKYEDAEVLYSKAANQLKVAKNCECFAAAAALHSSPLFFPRVHRHFRPPLAALFFYAPFSRSRVLVIFFRGRRGRSLREGGAVPLEDGESSRRRHRLQ